MDIPWQELNPETLRSLIEEFITREGTDYGVQEVSLETKVKQVHRQLELGKIKLVFDAETESCDLRHS
jgi:uncharacterized protein YheU (UPF0270 family)